MVNATLAYQRNSIEVGDGANIILALYEGALRSMLEAKKADDSLIYMKSVDKAMSIVRALIASLDFENGGEIAVNLYRLYDFILWRLDEALTRGEKYAIDEAYGIMDELYKAWVEALRNFRCDEKSTVGG
ncbi:MAG: flagellar export chaperone FliS [Thermosulfidibacteraceae bacterium]|jgi:flagellar protein FliS